MFLGIVGSRYGWTPPQYNVPKDDKYQWVHDYPAGRSITELEMRRGVLNPPNSRSPANRAALLYFRDEMFLRVVPEGLKSTFLDGHYDAADDKFQYVQQCVCFSFVIASPGSHSTSCRVSKAKRNLLELLKTQLLTAAHHHPDRVWVQPPYHCTFSSATGTREMAGEIKVNVAGLGDWADVLFTDITVCPCTVCLLVHVCSCSSRHRSPVCVSPQNSVCWPSCTRSPRHQTTPSTPTEPCTFTMAPALHPTLLAATALSPRSCTRLSPMMRHTRLSYQARAGWARRRLRQQLCR